MSKINKLDNRKNLESGIKNICIKNTKEQMKIEKKIVIHMTGNGLITKIHKVFLFERSDQFNFKMGKLCEKIKY